MTDFDEVVLCHCAPEDQTGHRPGEVLGCKPLRSGRYLRPQLDQIGEYQSINFAKIDARGTCPVCSKNVRVQRLMVHANYVHGQRLEPVINPARPRGSVLEIRPGMASHKVRGVECAGTGRVPTETRYTPGRELGYYLKIMKEERSA